MKRKLRLLLAMVLAMTMVMGISVTAFAATRPDGTSMDEAACTEHSGAVHIYSFGNVFGEYSYVEGIMYEEGAPISMPYYMHAGYEESTVEDYMFKDNIYTEGWYYFDGDKYCPCSGHGSVAEAFDSVEIDLSSVRAGATLWDIFSSVADSITTYPEDTIDINGINLTHGSSDSDLLLPTDPLEEGNTYTLWLTLQSTDYLFKQDSVSDYALSNLNIDAAYKNVLHDDSFADEGTILDMEIRFTVDSSTPGPNPPKPTPKKSESSHVHNFQWQTITEPTKDTDGLEGEVCSCGAVRNTQPLSAYGYALNEYATPMINAAKSGQTITFEFGVWNSFPKSFMAKLVDKSAQNVTFVFKYKWNHKLQTITIPAGTPIDLNFDWYGPAKMAELYGAN